MAAVDAELLEERAAALGRAGDRLERALARWQELSARDDVTGEQVDARLEEVAAATYALVVQRDCAGFRYGNLRWIRTQYQLPDEVLRRL